MLQWEEGVGVGVGVHRVHRVHRVSTTVGKTLDEKAYELYTILYGLALPTMHMYKALNIMAGMG